MKQRSTGGTTHFSPGLQRYFYVTAALCGAAIMIIEILGAKMLAPYVGTSHFVWTAQIAVALVALACGYYAGGRLADQVPKLSRLYAAILAAGVYLAATIVVVEPIAYWGLKFSLPVGSLLASTVLYFVPLALLAMVGPFLIRMITVSVTEVGGNIGRLSAVSTLGSFGGTLLIGYVLIPFLPNSVTMYLTAGTLLATGAAYFLIWGRPKSPIGGPMTAAVLGLLVGGAAVRKDHLPRYESVNELYRGNSNFGLLQVMESKTGDRRYYLNDYLTQNTYDPQTGQSLSLFTYMLHDLAASYTPQLSNALCIGMGVGIVPMQLAEEGVQVDVVEINPDVVPVAEKYFGCDPAKFNLIIADGRSVVNQSTNQYDAVILDAFLGDSSPSHLMTREAFEEMRRVLRPDGVLVINSFGELEAGRDFFPASLYRTLGAVFKEVRVHATGNGNIFFVAGDRTPLSPYGTPGFENVHPIVRGQARQAFANRIRFEEDAGIVLRDDYNPVDFYDAANREKWRRETARYWGSR